MKTLFIFLILQLVLEWSAQQECPYGRQACHGVICYEPQTRPRNMRGCRCQCYLGPITPLPFHRHTSRCNRIPTLRGKICQKGSTCGGKDKDKCGTQECDEECNNCYASCIISRYNASFPKNPRLIRRTYRSVEVQWDELKDINKTTEKTVYLFETFISSIDNQKRFTFLKNRNGEFERPEPRILIDNLLVNTKIRIMISLKARRYSQLFEVSPYAHYEVEPTEDVSRITIPESVTGGEIKMENKKQWIEWDTPKNILDSDSPNDKSIQYRIEACKYYHPIFKSAKNCETIGEMVANQTKVRQSTLDAQQSLFPFDVNFPTDKDLAVKITPITLNLIEGEPAIIGTRLNSTTAPAPPKTFKIEMVRHNNNKTSHIISWQIPDNNTKTTYLVEHRDENSNQSRLFYLSAMNATISRYQNTTNISSIPEITKSNYELGDFSNSHSYYSTPRHTVSSNQLFMSLNIKDLPTTSDNYFVRVAVFSSDNGVGPFSRPVKYGVLPETTVPPTSTGSAHAVVQRLWIIFISFITAKVLTYK